MEEIKEISKAMAQAFPEITRAGFDKENPHFKSKYASLGAVVEAIKPALSKYGLWFIQRIVPQPGCAAVETVIMHTSGELISCGITAVPVGRNDAQGYGSALTYAKRYSLSSAFGVVSDEDDDGNVACETTKQVQKSPVVQPKSNAGDEMKRLAARVVVELSNDPLLNCSIDPGDMLGWLNYCQKNSDTDIKAGVNDLLENDKPRLYKSFSSWLSKRDSQLS